MDILETLCYMTRPLRGAVAKWSGKGLQNPHTPVRIRPAPLSPLPVANAPSGASLAKGRDERMKVSLGHTLATRLVLVLALSVLALGCERPRPHDDAPFPEDFETSWTEARTPCTLSHDHELTYIRVFADALALAPYTERVEPYPTGARLLKVEYADEGCTEIRDYVVMERLESGSAPADLDWRWLRYDDQRRLVTDRRFEPDRCINCHTCHCAVPPYGWQFTCSLDGLEPAGGCGR